MGERERGRRRKMERNKTARCTKSMFTRTQRESTEDHTQVKMLTVQRERGAWQREKLQ
jgi:hypothetical protein